MKNFKAIIVLCGALVLVSCADTWNELKGGLGDLSLPSLRNGTNPEDFVAGSDCPKVEAVPELAAYNEFRPVKNPFEDSLITSVNLTLVGAACTYNPKSVTMDLKLQFDGRLGPAQKAENKEFFSIPFFVAVKEPGGNVLAKEVFAASLNYTPGSGRATYTENLRQIIPIANTARGPRYKVVVGFQLSPEQLAYNRAAIKRQKVMQDMQRNYKKPQIQREGDAVNAPVDLQGGG
ncbi:MAG: hypothetical protein L6Q57_07685 [Alphaproteobacteria bacterium]|nr:hypothetical protein [Alphaproteobacteria bacterium]